MSRRGSAIRRERLAAAPEDPQSRRTLGVAEASHARILAADSAWDALGRSGDLWGARYGD